ncbi:MAG: hypothetical protein V6Z78_04345 [Holosporaceae bacterium]
MKLNRLIATAGAFLLVCVGAAHVTKAALMEEYLFECAPKITKNADGTQTTEERSLDNYFPIKEDRCKNTLILGLTASADPQKAFNDGQRLQGLSPDVIVTSEKALQVNPDLAGRISQSFGHLNGMTLAFLLKGDADQEGDKMTGWLVSQDVAARAKEAIEELKQDGFENLTVLASHSQLRGSKQQGAVLNLTEEITVGDTVYPNLRKEFGLYVLKDDELNDVKTKVNDQLKVDPTKLLEGAKKQAAALDGVSKK